MAGVLPRVIAKQNLQAESVPWSRRRRAAVSNAEYSWLDCVSASALNHKGGDYHQAAREAAARKSEARSGDSSRCISPRELPMLDRKEARIQTIGYCGYPIGQRREATTSSIIAKNTYQNRVNLSCTP